MMYSLGILCKNIIACPFKKAVSSGIAILPGIVLLLVLSSASVWALDCGRYAYPYCKGSTRQFSGGFSPKVGYGGFGGGNCKAARTPVVFIHGNADSAVNWDAPVTGHVKNFPLPLQSVYDEFKAQGYNDCELFGLTYLTSREQKSPQNNYHRPEKYDLILSFLSDVMAYTGKPQVDIVAHSMGVSMSLAALSYSDNVLYGKAGWNQVRRFVNIAGGIRGLDICKTTGFFTWFTPTCGSENFFNKYVFGFYPDSWWFWRHNRWTGDGGRFSLRRAPQYHPNVYFYTLHAGSSDVIHCSAQKPRNRCHEGALFNKNPNVKAQLDVGILSAPDTSEKNNESAANHEKYGVGHFKARINSGQIIWQMLTSDCHGLECKGTYTGGPVSEK